MLFLFTLKQLILKTNCHAFEKRGWDYADKCIKNKNSYEL